MARLTDPIRLSAYRDALDNWRFDGFVQFELSETAYNWVKRELSDIILKAISHLMYEYVTAGGEIDEVRETRPEWADYDYHYDLRFTIDGIAVYVESRLHFRLPLVADESTILVVNIHAP